jgi:hypothetical protein
MYHKITHDGEEGLAKMSCDNFYGLFYWYRLIKASVTSPKGGGEGVGEMTQNVTKGGGVRVSKNCGKSVAYYLYLFR